jgi:peptide/nickel transport system ATP-binding protein
MSIMRLMGPPHVAISGAVRFQGEDLLTLTERQMSDVRGNDIAMIFQEPMTSLNPVLSVSRQITETLVRHQHLSGSEAQDKAEQLLKLVRIADPGRRLREYPHQLSGGMRQRVMIAVALACSPKLLIADEPTTALDVTVQAQILELIAELQSTLGMSVLLITHDFGVVAETCNRVAVMYSGRKIEEAPVEDLFDHPLHPYTVGLMNSMPHLDGGNIGAKRLTEIPGMVPSPLNMPSGCRFAPRCSRASDQCRAAYPPLREQRPGHWVSCWHPLLAEERPHG